MPTASKRAPIDDNPADHVKWGEMKDDGRRFRVTGPGAVGAHAEGATVKIKDFGPGGQVQRLLDSGLIAEVDPVEPEKSATATGDDSGRLDATKATGNPDGPAPKPGEAPVSMGQGVKNASDSLAKPPASKS